MKKYLCWFLGHRKLYVDVLSLRDMGTHMHSDMSMHIECSRCGKRLSD